MNVTDIDFLNGLRSTVDFMHMAKNAGWQGYQQKDQSSASESSDEEEVVDSRSCDMRSVAKSSAIAKSQISHFRKQNSNYRNANSPLLTTAARKSPNKRKTQFGFQLQVIAPEESEKKEGNEADDEAENPENLSDLIQSLRKMIEHKKSNVLRFEKAVDDPNIFERSAHLHRKDTGNIKSAKKMQSDASSGEEHGVDLRSKMLRLETCMDLSDDSRTEEQGSETEIGVFNSVLSQRQIPSAQATPRIMRNQVSMVIDDKASQLLDVTVSKVQIMKRKTRATIMPKSKFAFKLKDMSVPRKADYYDMDDFKQEVRHFVPNPNKPKVFDFKKVETDNEIQLEGQSLMTFGRCHPHDVIFRKPKKGMLELVVKDGNQVHFGDYKNAEKIYVEKKVVVGILLQFVIQEYFDKYPGKDLLLDYLLHPSISNFYQLKTADHWFPEEPEKHMPPLNNADDLESQLKLLQKDLSKAEFTYAEAEALSSPNPKKLKRFMQPKKKEPEKDPIQ